MPRELAPEEHVPDLEERVRSFAEEKGLVLNENVKNKLDWMKHHGGRCFCDWESERRCPCNHVFEDMDEFKGSCLCNLLMTPEKYRRYIKQKENRIRKTDENELKIRDEEGRKKLAEAKEIYKKIVGYTGDPCQPRLPAQL